VPNPRATLEALVFCAIVWLIVSSAFGTQYFAILFALVLVRRWTWWSIAAGVSIAGLAFAPDAIGYIFYFALWITLNLWLLTMLLSWWKRR
jgi:hypothetical protein